MNLRNLFEPIDRVIIQAKNYIHEQDIRKSNISLIEMKVEEIRPELERRKNELVELLNQIDPDDEFKDRLGESLKQIDGYLEHVELIAEKELALEILEQEEDENDDDWL